MPGIGTNSLGSKCRTGTNCLGNFGRPEHLAAGPSSLIHRNWAEVTMIPWNKADQSIIGSHIQVATEKIMRTQYTSVNDRWNDFKNAMSVIITADLVPSKISRKRPSNTWMTTDITRLLRRRQKAFSRARHTNKTTDWVRYKQLKTTVQKEARKAHDQYVDNTIS